IPNSRLCIFTGEVEKVNNIVDPLYKDKYIIKSLKSKDVINALTACDFGIILRDDNLTNNVAFPNKVSEYIEAGLNIIISESLRTPKEIVTKYNLGIGIKNDLNIDNLQRMIKCRKDSLVYIYELCNEVVEQELKYEKLICKRNIFN
ncbi:hypothetical protein, partial [Clostridium novyi]